MFVQKYKLSHHYSSRAHWLIFFYLLGIMSALSLMDDQPCGTFSWGRKVFFFFFEMLRMSAIQKKMLLIYLKE